MLHIKGQCTTINLIFKDKIDLIRFHKMIFHGNGLLVYSFRNCITFVRSEAPNGNKSCSK
jgi:hypothetical protein